MLPSQVKDKESPSREDVDSAIFHKANLFTLETSKLGKWDIASFVLTHFGQIATWYCPPETWFQVQKQILGTQSSDRALLDKTAAINQDLLEDVLVSPLLIESVQLSNDLHKGINLLFGEATTKEDFNLVLAAFSIYPSVRSRTVSKVIHRVYRPLLLDRAMDCFLEDQRRFPRQNLAYLAKIRIKRETKQIDMKNVVKTLPPKLAAIIKVREVWYDRVRRFVNDLETYFKAKSTALGPIETPEQGTGPNSENAQVVMKGSEKKITIGVKLEHAKNKFTSLGKIYLAMANLCDCAHGIYTILEASALIPWHP